MRRRRGASVVASRIATAHHEHAPNVNVSNAFKRIFLQILLGIGAIKTLYVNEL
jgi:hypothetical protein